MIILKEGNLLNVEQGLILHGCNAQGVMGSGIAKQIRDRWPNVYTEYKKLPTGPKTMGMFQPVRVTDSLIVGNCITQLNFGSDGKKYADLSAIRTAINSAVFWARMFEQPIAAPEIGCGLGGLTWEEVGPLFEDAADRYSVDITIYRYKP